MTRPGIIAVDGVSGRPLIDAAERLARARGGATRISRWDASGLFEQLMARGDDAGSDVSPRILMLLYAADLAFRLRWEIRPELAEGRDVVAAPYVETAIAFGRANGLPLKWLHALFRFAPRPSRRHTAGAAAANGAPEFIEFASATVRPADGDSASQLTLRAARFLARSRTSARRRALAR